jgi:histidine triad (HIT) family protein
MIHEGDEVVAFRDANPKAPTHVLIIPRAHVPSLAELDDPALGGSLLEAAREVARAEGLAKGWRVVTNVGTDGGQSVAHLHLHLLGGRSLGWPPG